MLKVGLTGGIGSGKSSVSRRLKALGAVVIDADQIAREVVEPGTPGIAAVVAAFGEGVLAQGGALDRAALGARVFPDPVALGQLNGILHPLIASRTAQLMADAERAQVEVLVHDVALLVEGGLRGVYDLVVVVDAPPEVQIARLVRLRGMTEADARARMARQASRADRLAAADVVLVNDGTPNQLEVRVDALWQQLTGPDSATVGGRT